MPNAQLNMIPGHRYRIVYRSDAHRKDHYCVMKYVGYDEYNYIFDARPEAGTQHMPKRWVKSIQVVDNDAKIIIDKIVR